MEKTFGSQRWTIGSIGISKKEYGYDFPWVAAVKIIEVMDDTSRYTSNKIITNVYFKIINKGIITDNMLKDYMGKKYMPLTQFSGFFAKLNPTLLSQMNYDYEDMYNDMSRAKEFLLKIGGHPYNY